MTAKDSPNSAQPPNLIRDAIRDATPQRPAQEFNLTPAAIASWSANKKVPWQHLVRLAELAGVDLKMLMDANSDASTQVFRGAERPLTLLKDLEELEGGGEVNQEDLVKQRFTGLLVGFGLTWDAVAKMSPAHREALYQLLIRKQEP